MNINELRTAQIRAAEDAVIASLPPDLKRIFDDAQRSHEAKGGCPGCGHMVLACHRVGCPTNKDDLY